MDAVFTAVLGDGTLEAHDEDRNSRSLVLSFK
jgi:hypothetical protein